MKDKVSALYDRFKKSKGDMTMTAWLEKSFGKFGLTPEDIPTIINFFKKSWWVE